MLKRIVFINSIALVFFAALVAMMLGPSYFNLLPIELVYSELCHDNSEICNQNPDSINIAVQLGRLDFISIVLAILATAIGLAAIFGFMSIKEQASIDAKEVAQQVVTMKVAEFLKDQDSVINLKIERMLSLAWEKLEKQIRDNAQATNFISDGEFTDRAGNDIGESWENENG